MAAPKQELREAAQELFLLNWDQKRIAKTLGVSEKTLSEWSREYKWREQRLRYNMFNQSSDEGIMDLIDYQLDLLKKITVLQREQSSEISDVEGLKKLLIDNKQLDGLQKLFTSLKGREIEWVNIVRIIHELMEYLGAEHPDLAKKLTEPAHAYIEMKKRHG